VTSWRAATSATASARTRTTYGICDVRAVKVLRDRVERR
jgi:hypothetical protein